MEILTSDSNIQELKKFKIDLIVWKLISSRINNRLSNWFKIDLIVWK